MTIRRTRSAEQRAIIDKLHRLCGKLGKERRYRVEFVCLAGYMRLLSPYLISEFRNRILNIHPALLPSFPGLDAQKQALEHGVKITGCT